MYGSSLSNSFINTDRMVKSTTPLTALYSEVALQKSTDEHALLESGKLVPDMIG